MEDVPRENYESFEMIYNKYYIPVYSFFRKRLSSKEICEDLTSEVFYSCLKSFDKYDPAKSTVATWIYVVANNKLKNYYRDRKDILTIDDTYAYDPLPDDTDMDGAIFLAQMREYLNAALRTS